MKPNTVPSVGDLIIRHEPDLQIPPGPPIIIRQEGAASIKPTTLTYRERPPRAPAAVDTEVIKVPGRVIEPPPRQVIIENMPDWPPAPADVYVERWLGYSKQKRNVVHEKPAPITKLTSPNNVSIEWDARDRTQTVQHFNVLGVQSMDPVEYERHHNTELIEPNRLPVYVNETNLKVPSGEVLASNIHSHEFQLVGDVEALSLVEETHNLNQYLRAKF